MLARCPSRNPSRIPRFTHAFVCQPVADAASGFAALTAPLSSDLRRSSKAAKAAEEPSALAPAAKHSSTLRERSSSFTTGVYQNHYQHLSHPLLSDLDLSDVVSSYPLRGSPSPPPPPLPQSPQFPNPRAISPASSPAADSSSPSGKAAPSVKPDRAARYRVP